ncbi:hypothetical protein DH2020_011822 [Rehmannia glutinosa]|uniref:Uncharacterized protein n=1 Tax=Rehmannia glutinosa TaxID=99300 RepID=A0ABR0XEJ2_REHGL
MINNMKQIQPMIMAAIEALNDKNGSNKSMKAAGQLVFTKNNYLKPDPNSPVRRGRGRPPKPKTPLPPGAIPLPPRPRGRPPKSQDPTAPPPPPKPKAATTTSTLSGKKRGRPPKAATAGVTPPPPPPPPPPLEVRLADVEGRRK